MNPYSPKNMPSHIVQSFVSDNLLHSRMYTLLIEHEVKSEPEERSRLVNKRLLLLKMTGTIRQDLTTQTGSFRISGATLLTDSC